MFFNIPYTCNESLDAIKSLLEHPEKVNEGTYLMQCKAWFEDYYPGYTAFMTTSCTRAMELIALSMNLCADDEIILSPYTYVGVGNAFSNYGAQLVYVDIDKTTMNIDASLIEAAITPKTKAVIAMHYAGIPCDMVMLEEICSKHKLLLIEDNAQGMQVHHNNQKLGSFGDFSCISFDMLKNISCNEGGVLMCKNEWLDRVDVAYNNGTNKTAFSKKLVNKYEWVSKGSKFGMSEYTAAVLYPLLVRSAIITAERKSIWDQLFQKIAAEESLRQFIPNVMLNNDHNGHLAYLKFSDKRQRDKVLTYLNQHGVPASFHYVPLDDSKEGKRISPSQKTCIHSLIESNNLVRLPIHNFLTEVEQIYIVQMLKQAIV